MSLRAKLLLAALSTLVLPWAGWRFVREVEALLRHGQEQAMLTSVGMLAKLLDARHVELPSTQAAAFYIERSRNTIVVDGYADDWSALRADAQAAGPAGDSGKLKVSFARDADAGLCMLVEVNDATRARADPSDPRISVSDHVTLVLSQDGDTRRYLLGGAAPGSFEAIGQGSAATLPERIPGAYQEDGSGYRIEIRLPADVAPDRIGVGVYDSAVAGADIPELRQMLALDADASRALQPLVPPRARARLVTVDGWLVAAAGKLDASSSDRDADNADTSWLGNAVYRSLIAPALGGSPSLDASVPRVTAPEVWQALSGVAATSWRPAHQPGAVVLTAAIPIRDQRGVRGALVFEQASRALSLLANRAVVELAAATLAALVVAALLLLVFGASLSLRIGRLRDAVDRAARRYGRLDGPLPLIDAADELGDLARSFDRLFDEVAANTDYLRTLASKLSHELNTPLAIVKSSLDNLDHHDLDAAARSYLGRARDGADRLGVVMRAMSEANRVERAIASADAEDFDLRALLAGCAESYRALAAPRELRVELPDAGMPFHGAPELIAQALDKLFDNACSFTPADGWIALSLEPNADASATIRVANAGPSLPATTHERLFNSLVSVRGKSSRDGAAPHLGLGLYVVRLVAELHRGSAGAANLASGDGVEFILSMRGMPRRRLARTTTSNDTSPSGPG